MLVILSLPLTWAAKLGFSLIVLAHAYFIQPKAFAPTVLAHDTKDLWRLYFSPDEKESVQLLPHSFISDFLLILRFKAKPPLLLLRCQLTQQDWRYLQLIVRNKPRA